MADVSTNIKASDDDAAKAGLSPWEDDLPEEPKPEAVAPQVVGSLEPEPDGAADSAKPVPFNIPANIDEKVGTKVPAEKYIDKSSTEDRQSQPMTADQKSPTDNRQSSTATDNRGSQAPIENHQTQPIPDDHQPPTATDNRPPEGGLQAKEQSISDQAPVLEPTSVTKPTTPSSGTISDAKAGVSELVDQKPKTADRNQNTGGSASRGAMPSQVAPPQPMVSSSVPPTTNIDSIKLAPDPFANVDLTSSTGNPEPPPMTATDNRPQSPSGGQPTADATSTPTTSPKKKISFPKLKIPMAVSYIGAALLLLVALTYLTELGILSIGLEKVYGLFQIETLWGGLPKNPERALGMSVVKMQENLEFKASGTVTMTVNKTIKSDITTPLVSMLQVPLALMDSNAAEGIKARLAATDSYYDDYYDDVTVDDGGTDSASSSSSSSPSTSSASSDSSTAQSQDVGSGYQTSEPTIKELKTEFNLTSGADSAQADITINKIVGSDSTISLVSSDSNLYVKSADIKFDEKSEANKWLKYSLGDMTELNPVGDVMNIKTDSGFTIIGKREKNEKISGTRCYKYLLSEIELGDALGEIGITSDMVQSMNGSVWIGVRDHLIRKISLTIIPSVSSSVSRIDLEMGFSEYGTANSITVPSLTNVVDLTGSSPSVTAAAGKT